MDTIPRPRLGLNAHRRLRPRASVHALLTLVTPAYAVPAGCGTNCDELERPAKHGLSAGATAGIVVGVVAVAVIAVSALVWGYYRRRPADNASVCTSRSASFEALPSDADYYDTLGSSGTRPSAATVVVGPAHAKSTDALAKHLDVDAAAPVPAPVPVSVSEKAVHRRGSSRGAAPPIASQYLAADTEKDLPVIPARDPTPLEREILALCAAPTADLRADLLRLFDASPPGPPGKLAPKRTHIEAQVRRMLEAPPSGVPRSPSPVPSLDEKGTREELRPDAEDTDRLAEDIRSVFQASQRHSSVNIPPRPQPGLAEDKTPKPKKNRGPRI